MYTIQSHTCADGPMNIKIKLGIRYPVGSHKKTSIPQYIALSAFVLEFKLGRSLNLNYPKKHLSPYV